MKNIEILKQKYKRRFIHKLEDFDLSDEKKNLNCSVISEIWAYFERIIPEDFLKCNLFDLHGITKDEKKLDTEIFIKAKNLFCKYCWGVEWQKIDEVCKSDDKKIKNFIWHNSVMQRRLQNGENLVIFGTSSSPVGKTIFASIAMKEAIKLRRKPGFRGQMYEWVDLSVLQHAIANEKDNNEIGDYRACDWLVVDNINRMDIASLKQREYLTGMLNPFFVERYNNKLPTILVFSFDIEEDIDMQKSMGFGLAKIVRSKRSYRLRLTPKFSSGE